MALQTSRVALQILRVALQILRVVLHTSSISHATSITNAVALGASLRSSLRKLSSPPSLPACHCLLSDADFLQSHVAQTKSNRPLRAPKPFIGAKAATQGDSLRSPRSSLRRLSSPPSLPACHQGSNHFFAQSIPPPLSSLLLLAHLSAPLSPSPLFSLLAHLLSLLSPLSFQVVSLTTGTDDKDGRQRGGRERERESERERER